jgi:hypothetical protein
MLERSRAACAVVFAALALSGCTPRAAAVRSVDMDVPRTTITAIELLTTGCFGTCPAFDVRFTADGRATYAGSGYAPRLGRFIGRVDFVRLAAWIDSQQPETLANSYAMGWIDTPHVTLVVERGAYRKIVTTANETQTPVRSRAWCWRSRG